MTTLKKIFKSFVDLLKRLFLPNKKIVDVYKEEALLSPGKVIAKRFIKNKLAIIGIIGFISIFIFSFNYTYLNVPKELIREGIVKISSGNSNSIGLSENGNVYVWGANHRDNLNVPKEVSNVKIVDVSAGSQHMVAMDENYNLYFWGYNHQQQAQIHTRFTEINAFQSDPIRFVKAGIDKTAVITESGKLYIWGVGANNPGDSIRRTPYVFTELDDENIILKAVDVEYNVGNVIVLLENGSIRVVGTQNDVFFTTPIELTDGTVTVTQIGVSDYNAFAVDSTGKLYVWGSVSFGLHEAYVPEEAKTNVKTLAVGYQHAIVVTNDGNIYSWGDNHYNQTEIPRNLSDVDKLFVNTYQNFAIDEDGNVHAWGLKGFIFGADEQGRNFFSQMVHGGKITLTVGAVAVLISLVIGVTVGLTAGYFGGRIDNLLMRFAEIVSSFPFLPFAITLSALLIGGATSEVERMLMIMVILGVLSWTGLARLIRGQILSERERDYVLAAKALGIKQKHIIWRHIFPAVISIVIVNATLGYAGSLLTEAGLSFLGFGVQKPNPSWGNILTTAQDVQVIRVYWWRWILPGLAIIIAALSINLIGDALRDAMDPKNAER